MSVSVKHTLAVWRRNASMYSRTWKWNLLPNFFEPVFYLTAVGIGVGAYIQEMGGMPYVAFLAPGLVCVSAMNGASFEVTYNVYVRMTFEKSYDAMLTTPIEPDDVLAGEILWALTRATIYGGSFFLIVVAFGLGIVVNGFRVISIMLTPGADVSSDHSLQGLIMIVVGVMLMGGIDWIGESAGDGRRLRCHRRSSPLSCTEMVHWLHRRRSDLRSCPVCGRGRWSGRPYGTV